jgi:hypothetical protein
VLCAAAGLATAEVAQLLLVLLLAMQLLLRAGVAAAIAAASRTNLAGFQQQ